MKKIISYIICFVMLLSFASCGNNDYVGVDKAKQTVVDDIGAALEDVEFAVNDLIKDGNGDYYDMKFTKDGTEYRYKVDAVNGKILEKTSDTPTDEDNSETVGNAEIGEGGTMESSSNNDNMLDNDDTTENSSNNNSTNNQTTSK